MRMFLSAIVAVFACIAANNATPARAATTELPSWTWTGTIKPGGCCATFGNVSGGAYILDAIEVHLAGNGWYGVRINFDRPVPEGWEIYLMGDREYHYDEYRPPYTHVTGGNADGYDYIYRDPIESGSETHWFKYVDPKRSGPSYFITSSCNRSGCIDNVIGREYQGWTWGGMGWTMGAQLPGGDDWAPDAPAFGAPLGYTVTIIKFGAVPEPASWAMMVAGFGLVGAAMRQRSTASTRRATNSLRNA